MQRVFEIATEAGVDVKTALLALGRLGSDVTEPTKLLDYELASKLRSALGRSSGPFEAVSASRPASGPSAARPANGRAPRTSSRPRRPVQPMSKDVLGPQHNDAVRSMIPDLFEQLLRCDNLSINDGVVVIYHDGALRPEYGLSNLRREAWRPPAGSGVRKDSLLAPLRSIDRSYRDRALMPPNTYIAIDVPNKRAWFGRSIHKVPKGPYLDAVTLKPIHETPDGPAARLAQKAQVFAPRHVPALVSDLSSPNDFPEEAFLLHEELLRLAVDSLHGDEQLDPLPVHINALWVFARPVIMRRPDNSERHVRAVWYRQGEIVWRMRTFAAGIGNKPKEVGERLSGRLPFVPVWDETRPEQKLLAAVWALMAQGGITESHRHMAEVGDRADNPRPGDLTIIRVKAGTEHAQVYRSDDPSNAIDRPSWTVRGHWRHQPYPSLGRDERGNVITKMRWIASYTKGDDNRSAHQDKVIVVHP